MNTVMVDIYLWLSRGNHFYSCDVCSGRLRQNNLLPGILCQKKANFWSVELTADRRRSLFYITIFSPAILGWVVLK